jgi:uncharacterized glyoxalase superfamily protein PhnB
VAPYSIAPNACRVPRPPNARPGRGWETAAPRRFEVAEIRIVEYRAAAGAYRTGMTRPQPINPVLVYDDIQAAHDFLVDAFGMRPGVNRDADGQAVHGEVHAGDATIWLHRVSPDHDLSAPGDLPAASAGLAVAVDDVDAHYEHARAAGARIDSEPTDQPYGRREYGARDPEGHRWWFGAPLH